MKYRELKKQYSLPNSKELEAVFDLETKDSDYLSREILKKISERFEAICERIQGVLNSDSNLESMYECNFINEGEKAKLFSIFKIFMSKRREITSTTFDFSDKENCELIKECYKAYKDSKKTLKEIFLKVSKKWVDKDNPISESAKYFG